MNTPCALAALAIFALSGCDILGGGDATYFALTPCDPGNNACRVHPTERLDITVSTSAQRVAWKTTELDGTAADYTTGSHCAVIASDDFKCDQLSMNRGKLSYGDMLTDQHIISWILWETSSQTRPTTMDAGFFGLLANEVASVVMVVAVIFGAIWVWAQLAS